MPHLRRNINAPTNAPRLNAPPLTSPAPPKLPSEAALNIVPMATSKVSISEQGSASPTVPLAPETPAFKDYTVKKGDSLSRIAKKHLGSANYSNEIFEANRNVLSNPDALRIGMTLKVPVPKAEETPSPLGSQRPTVRPSARSNAPVNVPAAPESPKDESGFVDYTIRRGDSLSRIAKRLTGNSKNSNILYEANRDLLMNPHDLRIGAKIRIPTEIYQAPVTTPAPVQKQPKPQQPQTGVPATESPATPPAPEPVYTEHTVGRGESLSVIALRMLGDSERYMEIYEANRDVMRNPNSLKPGMKLRIPNAVAQREESPSVSAPVSTGPVDSSGMTARAKELFEAMQGYQEHHRRLGHTRRTRTTPAEMREIAIELDAAGKAFNVDPKLMLALFAHESGGINPRAKSHTGAGGLGQLTGIAIKQVHHMSGIVRGKGARSPYREHRSNFVQSSRSINQRYNIKANVWTSTAYMKYELEDRSTRSQRSDAGRHVGTALKRYGDPNVRTYADKVNAEYTTLFGGKLF